MSLLGQAPPAHTLCCGRSAGTWQARNPGTGPPPTVEHAHLPRHPSPPPPQHRGGRPPSPCRLQPPFPRPQAGLARRGSPRQGLGSPAPAAQGAESEHRKLRLGHRWGLQACGFGGAVGKDQGQVRLGKCRGHLAQVMQPLMGVWRPRRLEAWGGQGPGLDSPRPASSRPPHRAGHGGGQQ